MARLIAAMLFASVFMTLMTACSAAEPQDESSPPEGDATQTLERPSNTGDSPPQVDFAGGTSRSQNAVTPTHAPTSRIRAGTPTADLPEETPPPTPTTAPPDVPGPTPAAISDEPECVSEDSPSAALSPPAQGSEATDREVPEALFQATGGESWDTSKTWLGAAPVRLWDGVKTNREGRVVSLSISNLGGELPPELGNLTSLETLFLYGTELGGQIPREIGYLVNLKYLSVGGAQMAGQIPPEIGNLVNLNTLAIGVPQLDGPIPPEIGNLANLRELHLAKSQLCGEIPPELGNLTQLVKLNLQSNQLSGKIPPGLGNLTRLDNLSLGHNQLGGEIPTELGNLTRLDSLSLGPNLLIGEIPPELGNLTALQSLNLSRNNLTGELPPEVADLPLKTMGLTDTGVSGCVSDFMWDRMGGKNRGHDLPVCEAQSAEDEEVLVVLHEAWRQAHLEDWLTREPMANWEGVSLSTSGRVIALDLAGKELGGGVYTRRSRSSVPIPPELGKLTELVYLDLRSNNLGGEIPPELGNLTKLRYVGLSQNRLRGEVPREWETLPNFEQFHLDPAHRRK